MARAARRQRRATGAAATRHHQRRRRRVRRHRLGQAEPACAQCREHALAQAQQVHRHLAAFAGQCRRERDEARQHGLGGLARGHEGLVLGDGLDQRVHDTGHLALGRGHVGVHAQIAEADGLRHAIAVAGHRKPPAVVLQHLLHLRRTAHQQAERGGLHAAVHVAHLAPRCVCAFGRWCVEALAPGGDLRVFGRRTGRRATPHAGTRTGGPGCNGRRRGRRRELVQRAHRFQRRCEQVQPPLQRHEGLVAEVDPLHLAVRVDVAEGAALAGFGHAQQRVGLRRRHARAVAAGHPALQQLELLGDARAVGHEDQAAVGAQVERRPHLRAIGHAAPHHTRHVGPAVARVHAPHVRLVRADPALRVGLVVEVVAQVAGRQHQGRAVLAPAHHRLEQRALQRVRRGAVGRQLPRLLVEHPVEHVDALAQLAHHQEAAVVQQRVRRRQAPRVVAVVRVAQQHLAQRHGIGRARLAGHQPLRQRLAQPVDETEVAARDAGARNRAGQGLAPAAHGLHAQHGHAGAGGRDLLHLGRQHRVQVGAVGGRIGQPQHQHQVHRGEIDTVGARRRSGRRVAQRALPVVGVVAAHVAQQAGARFHAVGELLRQRVEPLRMHAQRLQAGVRAGQVARHATLGGLAVAAERQRLEPAARLCSVGHLQQHQRTVGHARVALHDAALRQLRREGRRRRLGRRRVGLPEPGQLVAERLLQRRQPRVLEQAFAVERAELLQQAVREAQQHEVVAQCIGREHGRQPVQPLQRAQRDRGGGLRVAPRFLQRTPRHLGLRRRRQAGDGAVGRTRVAAFALHAFELFEVGLVAQRHRRVGVEEPVGQLVPAHPGAVLGEAAVARAGVVGVVAEQGVEQRPDVAVDHAHVGLPAAVEGDVQRQLVRPFAAGAFAVARRDGIAEAVDDAEAADGVGEGRARGRGFAGVQAGVVQRLQQPVQALDVADALEARHEAFAHGRQHGQVGDAAQLRAAERDGHGESSDAGPDVVPATRSRGDRAGNGRVTD